MTLDRTHVYDGKHLDLDTLFKLHDVFEQAEAFFDTVGGQAREMQALIADTVPPDIAPGARRPLVGHMTNMNPAGDL